MAKTPKNNSTLDFVDIIDIQDILVLLKDGSLRAVIEVESVNFDLKGNDEQIAILQGFQNFLNSLDFPTQISIQSRKMDMTKYISSLEEVEKNQQNELLRAQVKEYGKFVQNLSQLSNIMVKRFFVVVPYFAIEDMKEQGQGIRGTIKSFLGSAKSPKILSNELISKYRPQIEQRISITVAGLMPLGLKTRILNKEELLSLYYGYFNPGKQLPN